MNKKIKIIDLLNKIANGEEVPSNIKVEDKEYCLDGSTYYTVGEDDEDLFCLELYTNTLDFLKTEVEILEEIEEIGEFVDLIGMNENEEELFKMIRCCTHKIDELVKAVNKMKEGKE